MSDDQAEDPDDKYLKLTDEEMNDPANLLPDDRTPEQKALDDAEEKAYYDEGREKLRRIVQDSRRRSPCLRPQSQSRRSP